MAGLKDWLHVHRSKHQRLMARAQAEVERSNFHMREATRYGKGMSVEYADASQLHFGKARESLRAAKVAVRECGCERSLWPDSVAAVL